MKADICAELVVGVGSRWLEVDICALSSVRDGECAGLGDLTLDFLFGCFLVWICFIFFAATTGRTIGHLAMRIYAPFFIYPSRIIVCTHGQYDLTHCYQLGYCILYLSSFFVSAAYLRLALPIASEHFDQNFFVRIVSLLYLKHGLRCSIAVALVSTL